MTHVDVMNFTNLEKTSLFIIGTYSETCLVLNFDLAKCLWNLRRNCYEILANFFGFNELGYNEFTDIKKMILSPKEVKNSKIYMFYNYFF